MESNFNIKTFEKLNDRENLQNLFDRSFLEMDKNRLRSHYQTLRKLEFQTDFDFDLLEIPISELLENLTIACDIICTENNINFIYCGNSTSNIKGNLKLISKAILNLLSNAFLYSKGSLVTVKAIEKQDFVQIEIQNSGCLAQNFEFCNGLNFVQRLCNKLGGYFFIESTLLSVKSVMILPKSRSYKNVLPPPHFCELLSDRLSPVYVEFFGID